MFYCDTHVHSFRSFVGAPDVTLQNLSQMASELNIHALAVTDHLMKPEDVEGLRLTGRDIRAYNAKIKNGQIPILFGVEVCEVARNGSTLLDKALIEELQFDIIIGGVHETHMDTGASLEEIAVMQHKHHMMFMENPNIDILVHPWWLDRQEFERLHFQWPHDLSFIPEDLTVELARASKRTNTYIEISTMSGICNQDVSEEFRKGYEEYYRLLKDEGALFAIGTDTHQLADMRTFEAARQLIQKLDIPEDRFYRPEFKQI